MQRGPALDEINIVRGGQFFFHNVTSMKKKTVYTDSSDSIVVHTGKLLAVSCNSLISDHACCIKSVRSVVITRVSTHSAHYYQNALSKYVSKGQLKGTECTKLLNSPVITNNT